MDLDRQVTLTRKPKSSGNAPEATQLSLFEAVRRWTDDEGISLVIEDGGRPLSDADIQLITHSEDYKRQLEAFDERL